jgi:hypothetical protein
MADELDQTTLFRKLKAMPSVPDPMADKVQVQAAFDEVLSQLGTRAPPPGPKESDHDYLATLGETCAIFGPEERKRIDRSKLPSAALAAFVNEDLEIAKQEALIPKYTLREGVLTERRRADQSGREFIEFYSASGPSIWMDQFADPVLKYVTGGSNGIANDTDRRPPNEYSFIKRNTNPELVALQKQAAYQDSAEFKVKEAYRQVGKEPPPDVLKMLKT